MSEREEWLADLKAGDEVIVRTGYGYPSYDLRTVERATPTQVLVGNTRFRRKDGGTVGGDRWSRSSIVPPTPELKDRVRRALLIGRFDRATKWDALPTDALEQIAAIIEAHRKPA